MPANNMCRQGIPSQEGPISAWPTNGHPIDEFFKQYEDISVSTQPVVSDTIDGNRKAGDTMSFVGMMLCDDKIIAFGDSKATITTSLGTQMEDKRRGEIRKVFACNDYVLSVCGANSIICGNGIDQKLWYLEDWIPKHMKDYPDYARLLQRLCDEADLNRLVNDPIQFLIGSQEDNVLFIREANISANGITYKPTNINTGTSSLLLTMGWPYYRNFTCEIAERFDGQRRGNIDDEPLIKMIVEGYIKNADEIGSYNPAGCPVNTEVWPPEN